MAHLISRLATSLSILLFSVSSAYANVGSITEFRGNGTIKRGSSSVAVAQGAGIRKESKGKENKERQKRIERG